MTSLATPMPAVFFGHGSPMNALESNRYTAAWRQLGQTLPRPRAILAVSAHWYTRGTLVTAMARPRTIHDFFGFPQALFDVRYPAPGDPALAARVRELVAPTEVALDQSWGLDHGTWSVLVHAYPDADVPVVQLSMDGSKPPAWHLALGARLAPLRDEGVLIVGSGNVVHNLRAIRRESDAEPYDWAVRYESEVRGAIGRGDFAAVADYESAGEDARHSVPTPDHFLPLLYVLGTRRGSETVSIPLHGIQNASISMLCCVVGG